MPGPESSATTCSPTRLPWWTRSRTIRPCFACSRMFRATSEIAVAMTVRSEPTKPICPARLRPSWRAVTISAAERIGTTASLGMLGGADPSVEEGQAFLQIEGGGHVLERQAELDHGERDLGLDPYDHRLGAAQADHVRDRAERPHREGVDDVEAGDDDVRAHEARGVDRLHEVVRDRRVDGRDARDVDDDDLGAVGADAAEELLGELPGALRVDDADDGKDEEPVADLKDGRRQLADGFLLLADDALALLHEADGDRVRDSVRGGLVR